MTRKDSQRCDAHRNLPGQARKLGLYVFLVTFVIQGVKFSLFLADGEMWANQISYLQTRNPGLFDFNMAYGHPGTTLLEIGSLFHLVLGLPYYQAIALSTALLVALLTAACAALCFLLRPRSFWWFTTAFILTFSRFYIDATPPTAAVMPFITLLVLSSCWLWRRDPRRAGALTAGFGILVGLSAATRLDVTCFVAFPLFALLCYRTGSRSILPGLAAGAGSFFAANPFLWFMPIQHLKDLLWKFSYHYAHYNSSVRLAPVDWIYALPLALMAMTHCLFLLRRPDEEDGLPKQVLLMFLALTVLAIGLVSSSRYQAVRYLYPFLIVWEVFLAQFIAEKTSDFDLFSATPVRLDNKTAFALVGFILPTQVLGYLWVLRCFGGE